MERLLKRTTFLVKMFMRPQCLERAIVSVHAHYPGARILVADDSTQPARRTDATVYPLPYDSGLSRGRNHLLDRVDTEFLVLMDDDHVLTEDTRIESLVGALDGAAFDLVGVHVHEAHGHFPWEGIFERDGDTLTISAGHRGETGGFQRVDMCHNFFAASTEAVRRVRWDDDLKLGEHLDFFLRAKTAISVGLCPGVRVFHAPERPQGYANFRGREREYRIAAMRKHGLRRIVNRVFPPGSLDLDERQARRA